MLEWRNHHLLSLKVIVPSKSVKKMNLGFVFIAGNWSAEAILMSNLFLQGYSVKLTISN